MNLTLEGSGVEEGSSGCGHRAKEGSSGQAAEGPDHQRLRDRRGRELLSWWSRGYPARVCPWFASGRRVTRCPRHINISTTPTLCAHPNTRASPEHDDQHAPAHRSHVCGHELPREFSRLSLSLRSRAAGTRGSMNEFRRQSQTTSVECANLRLTSRPLI